MQWTPTQLRSTAYPSIPTASSSWPLALQIRWVCSFSVELLHSVFPSSTARSVLILHELNQLSGLLLFVDGGSLGPEEPEAEAALI